MGEPENFYAAASYDDVVKKVTVVVWILLVAESLFFVYLFSVVVSQTSLAIVLRVIVPSISLIVLLVPYLFKPKGFRLTAEGLGIERLLNTITVPYNQIVDAQRGKWTWNAVRLGGSGGLYGYLGLFHLFGIGRVWMHTTNRHKMILIETKEGKKYAVSPENPEEFISQLQKKIIK